MIDHVHFPLCNHIEIRAGGFQVFNMSSTSLSDRRKSVIPRPPPSSLRPSSPPPSTPTTPNANYTVVTPHAVPLSPRRSAPSTPPPQKTRARDLLRKHYGLGVGPPPPLAGKAADSDPMNLGNHSFGGTMAFISSYRTFYRFHCIRCKELL